MLTGCGLDDLAGRNPNVTCDVWLHVVNATIQQQGTLVAVRKHTERDVPEIGNLADDSGVHDALTFQLMTTDFVVV